MGEGEPVRVFVVDDDPHLRALVGAWLEAAGLSPALVDSGESCLLALADETPAAVLLDLSMPGLGGIATLERIRAHHAHVPVIVLTAAADVATIVETMRKGAYDFLSKPIERTKLVTTVVNAIEKHAMELRIASLERDAAGAMPGFTGESPPMRRLYHLIDRVAATDISVFIHGESGTGKELVARAIHARSGRAEAPFVALNCAAIPESLQDSELFGHEKGAFTGAAARRLGSFEQVAGGSLFLDEVAELSPATQAKLLRVLQERRLQRVGSSQEIPVDFRLISATHQDLGAAARAGRFREDLYYRIVVFELEVPPLRQRGDDVVLLARRFLAQAGRELRGREVTISEEALARLRAHRWPGNVRELQNVCQRALVTCEDGVVRPGDLPGGLGLPSAPNGPSEGAAAPAALSPSAEELPTTSAPSTLARAPAEPLGSAGEDAGLSLAGMEKQAIVEALRQYGGNRARASKQLGIGRTTLYRKLREYGIE
ncbi:sigma-54 dependent transcriptional regulator [Anaeromyxobacter sp. SG66]|uniref:sigma-54-dependent transcriptional regulator n=1 Tax=Anaeromyxobacter sp. SG66 TaxID=2925410 RepID=UPI001F5684E2|nr:sigma-54 dependent transcriptional regulator [Anaeromyxobacter sp. SG66]